MSNEREDAKAGPDHRATTGDEREPRSFQELLREAQAGSQAAAKELYETYVSHVLRCVRNRMWHRLRPKFDSQDFVQQVWASFFVGDTKLPDFQTPDDLIAYLMRLATNKVVMEGRRGRQPKNDARLEELIDGSGDPRGPHPRTRLPTPSAVAVFREQYDNIVEQQQPETREIAELRYEGMTYAEIAEEMEIHESNARKAMRRLKRRVTEAEENDKGPRAKGESGTMNAEG
jgi:RNA polymerase sigma factor (sigma-70 family)